jgi:hypothetical protein
VLGRAFDKAALRILGIIERLTVSRTFCTCVFTEDYSDNFGFLSLRHILVPTISQLAP